MEHIEKILFYENDLPVEDQNLIRSTLEKHDVLTLFAKKLPAADLWLYRREFAIHKTTFGVLLDLNALKDILSVARIDHTRDSERRKLGAALILFFQQAEISIEPSLAIYESPRAALSEIRLLRRIDNTDPKILLKIFKGEWTIIPDESLADVPEFDLPDDTFDQELNGSLAFRTTLTKIACIDRKSISPYAKAKEFIDWIHFDFIHVREAIHLCFCQFAPNSKKRLLKSATSPNFKKRKQGIDNALGDLLLIRDWLKRCGEQQNQNQLWLLCSGDKPLTDLARSIQQEADTDEEAILKTQSEIAIQWGNNDGLKILNDYLKYRNHQADPRRRAKSQDFSPYAPQILEQLEQELKSDLVR